MLLLGILLACGEKTEDTGVEESTEETTATDTEEEAEETNETGEEAETGGAESIESTYEDYQTVYCDYAIRCELYTSQEECIADAFSWVPEGCVVVNQEEFDICTGWFSELDCSYQGWIDECSTFFECP